MQFIDSHAHLNDPAFDADREELLSRTLPQAGLILNVEIGCAPEEWQPALDLVSRYPHSVRAVLGVHPEYACKMTDAKLTELAALLPDQRNVAVGEIGLDYTLSTYASEGGNFGSFVSFDVAKRLNAKMYAEAERLGVKWILGGECGHMWRVVNQYMATYNGPTPPNMEVPVSPITGTVFKNAAATKMVHIAEFTADLIKHNKLNLRPERNNHIITTWHDSCNPARAMGLLEEPRYILRHVCNNFVEMPEHTIREETFCCGSGSGLNAEEIMDQRLRGGFPRANALRYVHDTKGVNWMGCVCALDRAALPPLVDYWVPGVTVSGLHELVANALVMKGEIPRTMDLRQEDLPFPDEDPAASEEA